MKLSNEVRVIMERAKSLGGKPAKVVSGERFMAAAVIVAYENRSKLEYRELLYVLRSVVGRTLAFKRMLLNNIESGVPENDYIDGQYMKNALKRAEMLAEDRDPPEITAAILAAVIMAEPSPGIQGVMNRLKGTPMEEQPPAGEESLADMMDRVWDQEETKLTEKAQEPPKKQMGDMVAKTRQIRTHLLERIYGQDKAVSVFAAGYFQACLLELLEPERKKPMATFLFAGPPGVGKTFLAEEAAAALELPFRRFDMSGYCDKEASLELIGSDKVYKNAKAGNLTSFVAENPRCVLLFDEIEKAHLNVIHLFLQLLDAGRLRDAYTDKEVDFTKTIVILTTNAGKSLYEGAEGDLSGVSRKVIIKALQGEKSPNNGNPLFPAAICSRFASGNVVMFNHMGAHDLLNIVKREIRRHSENLLKKTDICFSMEDAAYTAMLLSEGASVDARTVRARAETFFNDELFELLRLIAADPNRPQADQLTNIRVTLDTEQLTPEVKELFVPARKITALVFGDKSAGKRLSSLKGDGLPELRSSQDPEKAMKDMEKTPVDLVLWDAKFGMEQCDNLNAEDADSLARDFFRQLRKKYPNMPVYLLTAPGETVTQEETVSFQKMGVRTPLSLDSEDSVLTAQLRNLASNIHHHAGLRKLARENKILRFDTAQQVSDDGKEAAIRLYDLRLEVAIESEDAEDVVLSIPEVRFDQVIGAKDAKGELAYFVEYLKDPRKYAGTGVKAPKGVLLYGPPGTGKTMLAKAMAREAGVTFLATEGNDFIKSGAGAGAEKVHKLFRIARKYAPAVLFIDEIDAIARERRGYGGEEDTLTAFLTEMDGFSSDTSRPVFVLAATNFDVEPGSPRSLDPALMRRFDRRILIDLPVKEDRILFMNKKRQGNQAFHISHEMVENLGMRSVGMSLAELDSAMELALRSAIRTGSTVVTDEIMEDAFETFRGGDRKQWDKKTLERTARHEAGHAMVSFLSGVAPAYVTVVSRGNFGGYMLRNDEGKYRYTAKEMEDMIRISMAGRAAEMVYYPQDGLATGAVADLQNATHMALRMICVYGMDKEMGMAVYSEEELRGGMPREVRQRVNEILEDQLAEAIRMISHNKEKFDALVTALLERNQLSAKEIKEILE